MWRLLSPRGRRAPRTTSPARYRPRVDALEDRRLLSTLTVTSAADNGPGSLRAEIAAAGNGDTIAFAPSLDGQTITLTSGELDINTNLSIQGPGSGQLTISGQHLSRVFEVNATKTVGLNGLTLSNGDGNASNMAANTYDGSGGAILNHGTLTVSGCTLSGNTAGSGGGGGIYNDYGAMLTVSASTLTANVTSRKGGAVLNHGTLTVSGCTLSGNTAYQGGAIFNFHTATVSGCTLSYNRANGGGGAIYNVGGLTVRNNVFKGNYPDSIESPAGTVTYSGNTFYS